MILKFGKYKGSDIRDVPDDYLAWIMDTETIWPETRAAAEREWKRRYPDVVYERVAVLEFPAELVQPAMEIVTTGFRACARKYHPDAGGDGEAMRKINLAMEVFRKGIVGKNGS